MRPGRGSGWTARSPETKSRRLTKDAPPDCPEWAPVARSDGAQIIRSATAPERRLTASKPRAPPRLMRLCTDRQASALIQRVLDDAHLLCFLALLTRRHLELDLVAFVQRLVATSNNVR